MGVIACRRMLGATVLCSVLLAPAAARANSTVVTTLSAESPITAGRGWLIWSVHSGNGWSLEGFHDGRIATLGVASRPQPFDAQVGTNAAGAPVVTYSRCRVTPAMEDAGLEVKGSGTLARPSTGAGCRLRVLELDSGRERSLPVPEPGGVSDTTPAMWRGTLVFARKTAGHAGTSQVMLSLHGHPSKLVTLPHGAVPEGCPQMQGCKEFPAGGEVQALSIDAQIVAFVWKPEGPDVNPDGAWEERVDSLARRRRSSRARPPSSPSSSAEVATRPSPPPCFSTGKEAEALQRPPSRSSSSPATVRPHTGSWHRGRPASRTRAAQRRCRAPWRASHRHRCGQRTTSPRTPSTTRRASRLRRRRRPPPPVPARGTSRRD